MDTNCASLVAALLLFYYESDFIISLSDEVSLTLLTLHQDI